MMGLLVNDEWIIVLYVSCCLKIDLPGGALVELQLGPFIFLFIYFFSLFLIFRTISIGNEVVDSLAKLGVQLGLATPGI